MDWSELQRVTLPGTGECPDFFPLPVDGTDDIKWVFWAADGHYLTGDFDGMRFAADGKARLAYAGGEKSRGHAYAGQTWSDVGDGRRIHIAWIRGNIPGMPFNQQMSLPLEMGLRQTAAGLRLTFKPIGELDALVSLTEEKTPGASVILPLENKACRIHMVADAGGAIDMSVGDFSLELDAGSGRMQWGDKSLSYAVFGDKLDMQLIFDRASLEIFGNDSLFYIALNRPGILSEDLILKTDRGIDRFNVSRLESIW
jgi:sucrose-6-phosphate hydrolase SacC (GH32 family)